MLEKLRDAWDDWRYRRTMGPAFERAGVTLPPRKSAEGMLAHLSTCTPCMVLVMQTAHITAELVCLHRDKTGDAP